MPGVLVSLRKIQRVSLEPGRSGKNINVLEVRELPPAIGQRSALSGQPSSLLSYHNIHARISCANQPVAFTGLHRVATAPFPL
ncbi:uncharacterized protein B0H18DRAFT_95566 [Fomitopsis serialis]|uniref:uncharacterized protein n=1 Tax=Fomitopsis serialis TaxID=139415 RepID=UPI002007AE06|nr:uncharacterized protein B0H18DRAFT_95566 [Neoantrodia serialis]KAH9915543.1 hypothetical protein B0H18DRAFT_95566 [Neoantrodia serialis]